VVLDELGGFLVDVKRAAEKLDALTAHDGGGDIRRDGDTGDFRRYSSPSSLAAAVTRRLR
jgi:hypothetical protein